MYKNIKFLFYSYFPTTYRILNLKKVYIKFFIIGAVTLSLDLLFLFLLYDIFRVSLLVSTALAFFLSFFFNFFANKFWSFGDKELSHVRRQLFNYSFVSAFNLLLNVKLMHVFTNLKGVNYLLSQFLVTVLIGIESFIIYNFFIFRKKH